MMRYVTFEVNILIYYMYRVASIQRNTYLKTKLGMARLNKQKTEILNPLWMTR